MYLILFDIDGTLLDSGGCGRTATRRAMQEVFHTTGALDRVNFAGKTDWQILLEALEPAGISAQQVQVRLQQYNQTVARHLAQIAGQFPIKPCIGAPEVVTALRTHPGALVGLVTGNMAALVPIKLRAAGYDRRLQGRRVWLRGVGQVDAAPSGPQPRQSLQRCEFRPRAGRDHR